jgi:hypothetical protein
MVGGLAIEIMRAVVRLPAGHGRRVNQSPILGRSRSDVNDHLWVLTATAATDQRRTLTSTPARSGPCQKLPIGPVKTDDR